MLFRGISCHRYISVCIRIFVYVLLVIVQFLLDLDFMQSLIPCIHEVNTIRCWSNNQQFVECVHVWDCDFRESKSFELWMITREFQVVWCRTSILLIWLSDITFRSLFVKQMDELQVIRGFVKAAKRLKTTMCNWWSGAKRHSDIFIKVIYIF
jgi:hypothetical protein